VYYKKEIILFENYFIHVSEKSDKLSLNKNKVTPSEDFKNWEAEIRRTAFQDQHGQKIHKTHFNQ
jgi:hypothetical protein